MDEKAGQVASRPQELRSLAPSFKAKGRRSRIKVFIPVYTQTYDASFRPSGSVFSTLTPVLNFQMTGSGIPSFALCSSAELPEQGIPTDAKAAHSQGKREPLSGALVRVRLSRDRKRMCICLA
jgi:hypothetical protein